MNAIFEQHPHLQSVFQTSDKECFFHESDAKNHAKSLKNRHVEECLNPNYINVNALEDVSGDDDFESEKIGEAIFNEMEEIESKPDGSESQLDNENSETFIDSGNSPAITPEILPAGTPEEIPPAITPEVLPADNAGETHGSIQHEMAKDEGKELPATPQPAAKPAPKAAPKRKPAAKK